MNQLPIYSLSDYPCSWPSLAMSAFDPLRTFGWNASLRLFAGETAVRTKVVVAALLLIGAGVFWLFGVGTPGAMNLPRPFSASRWKAPDEERYARCSMVADLRHRIGLVGKTRVEIIRLLGAPDEQQSGYPTVYLLCPSMADIFILELEWKQGRVASAIVRDT